ncbi:hypothetical protein [Haloferax sp. ATB1]|uniref:hypothetical protein n=1 Tax=Haloferax sp. ATB1 TaxID=1508454 RepID=UPI0005B204F0|nr:hypothetical protein [Haloferax sp. ATB1]
MLVAGIIINNIHNTKETLSGMAHRSRDVQKAHDKGVLAEARDLEKKGWDVKADISGHGYGSPPTVNGHQPDVYATKRGGTRIVEIETDPDDDPDQHTAFRRSAGQTGANFYGWVVDKGGNRRTRFE